MGRLISFSGFDAYYSKTSIESSFVNGTILDTNILISLMYEVKLTHDEIVNFLDEKIVGNGISCYTNVITTAEFLNIFRRILLTEHLCDSIDEFSKLNFPKKSKYLIKRLYGEYKHRFDHEKKDIIFAESHLKQIRDTFSGSAHSGLKPWPELTQELLGDELEVVYKAYEKAGIIYISPNEDNQKHYFNKKMIWEDTIKISASSGLAIFDAMILNALQCSHFSFLITADADIAYATLANCEIKDVVVPDSIFKEMKKYNFKI
ncbi:MAG: hypothetical protein A2417_15110 [Bdellovibrionales bacterium RIFOXYC1_FULL_37_79]|nr:MAG: hypothetical protein A2417_15110 [Bdellovibrionales bacterium RIFOXYC1_FULL_37_79]